jgi:hypothetical protein
MAEEYRELIATFVSQHMPVEAFEAAFLRKFKAETRDLERPLFEILEDLFEDVDAYSPLWTVADETPVRITETTLRREAETALAELDRYLLIS